MCNSRTPQNTPLITKILLAHPNKNTFRYNRISNALSTHSHNHTQHTTKGGDRREDEFRSKQTLEFSLDFFFVGIQWLLLATRCHQTAISIIHFANEKRSHNERRLLGGWRAISKYIPSIENRERGAKSPKNLIWNRKQLLNHAAQL